MPTDTWDDFAAGWDAESAVQQYADKAYESWQRRVAPLIENISEIRILDFGCGTGLLTERLAPLCREIVAVDTSVGMIDVLDSKMATGSSCASNYTCRLTLTVHQLRATPHESPAHLGRSYALAARTNQSLPLKTNAPASLHGLVRRHRRLRQRRGCRRSCTTATTSSSASVTR